MDLIRGHEEQVKESWFRLLGDLQRETAVIRQEGSSIIPEISFSDVKHNNIPRMTRFRDQLLKCGVAIIRGVVPKEEALGWKELTKRYIKNNPSVKGFPQQNPIVYELYWSPAQVLARAHPNMLHAQAFLMSHWHSVDKSALISPTHPVSYADRLRIRPPGDAGFALGPHVDGGSCERWERNGYGKGGVYDSIFRGEWETFNPWESSCRLPVVSDLYNGAGGCSVFRMFQGWLAMSTTSPNEGTLKVNPLLARATSYFLLRPFFEPKRIYGDGSADARNWGPDNWNLEAQRSSVLQGAHPGSCQELDSLKHPHLMLDDTMVSLPTVRPGDYVAWHCDTIHAVDRLHTGHSDSSVMYIPAAPLTEANAEYLVRQRETFYDGIPAPDYPSGEGEALYYGRLTPDFVMQNITAEAQQAMGLSLYNTDQKTLPSRDKRMLDRANQILGFADP